jgi:hypothetical protein
MSQTIFMNGLNPAEFLDPAYYLNRTTSKFPAKYKDFIKLLKKENSVKFESKFSEESSYATVLSSDEKKYPKEVILRYVEDGKSLSVVYSPKDAYEILQSIYIGEELLPSFEDIRLIGDLTVNEMTLNDVLRVASFFTVCHIISDNQVELTPAQVGLVLYLQRGIECLLETQMTVPN